MPNLATGKEIQAADLGSDEFGSTDFWPTWMTRNQLHASLVRYETHRFPRALTLRCWEPFARCSSQTKGRNVCRPCPPNNCGVPACRRCLSNLVAGCLESNFRILLRSGIILCDHHFFQVAVPVPADNRASFLKSFILSFK